jgi:hypothetical protein
MSKTTQTLLAWHTAESTKKRGKAQGAELCKPAAREATIRVWLDIKEYY